MPSCPFCSTEQGALLSLLSGRFCSLRPCPSTRPNLATGFLQSGRVQHSTLGRLSLPFLSTHHCRLSLHTLDVGTDHTRRFPQFVHSVWNGSSVQTNLQLAICRFPIIAFDLPNNQLALRLPLLDAVYTLLRNQIVVRTLPECADAAVHLQSPRRSIFCRL